MRNPSSTRERGATAIQLLVILVPVIFAFMGFAVDLGRLYLIRGELKSAAEAMALAAAQKLIGTESSTGAAAAAAQVTLDNSQGLGNKYDFGSLQIGDTNGELSSEVSDPMFFDTVAAATEQEDAAGGEAVTGAAAKHVRIDITAQAPLVFWSFFQQALSRQTPVSARAVAGLSAPLCTACGIEPLAIAAIDPEDTTNFGFVPDTRYTFGFVCSGSPTPGALAGAGQRIPYLLLNRLNEDAEVFADESTQAFRIGAQGLVPSTNAGLSCVTINAEEQIWASAAPTNCRASAVPALITSVTCGIATRLESEILAACENIPEIGTLSPAYNADTDVTDLDEYAAYTGNTRRVITVPLVDALVPGGTMVVLGFRQFLIEPNQNSTNLNPTDSDGRFVALYIGSVVPVQQGQFSGCQLTAGPGKVVLYQ